MLSQSRRRSQDEYCIVDCPDFAGCYVQYGRDHESISNGKSQGTGSLGKEPLGLILPLVTSIMPWLTILAAIGLTLIQLLAIFTEHLPKKEYSVIPINLVLLALSMFIVIGRWVLFL